MGSSSVDCSTNMDKQTIYLIDDIIRYSLDHEMPLDRTASHLLELAKQRLPEYRLESEQLSGESELFKQVRESDAYYIIMRVPIRSWIHEVHWNYFPEFHVISSPREDYAFPVHANIETWHPESDPKKIYLDDLFFDSRQRRFWQPEPFLIKLPASARLYKHITSNKLEPLRGTPFLKIVPDFIAEILQSRSGIPNYTIRACKSDLVFRNRPFGSKGWKERMIGVRRYWSICRKTSWKFGES